MKRVLAFSAKYRPELFLQSAGHGSAGKSYLQALEQSLQARGLQDKIDLSRLVTLARDQPESDEYTQICNQLPNLIHPSTPIGPPDAAKVLYMHGQKPAENAAFLRLDASLYGASKRDKHLLLQRRKKEERQYSPLKGLVLNQLKTINTSLGAGSRTYYFLDQLALLEQALLRFTLDSLQKHGFSLVSVPETVPLSIVEACGFPTGGQRSQLYELVSSPGSVDLCLAGTAEIPLAAFCAGRTVQFDDPADVMALCAVSKCYRREISTVESSLYRTHQFNKVEMFCVTRPQLSEQMFDKLLKTQIELYSQLDIHFRVLEMPSSELGRPAFRKIDIEAWMPGERIFGEISSTSNCTDFQARRLHIFCGKDDQQQTHAHTLNATACAIPRLMKAILETNQQADGTMKIPIALRPYMDDQEYIAPNESFQLVWLSTIAT